MPDEPELRLWTEGAFRCEYWAVSGAGELRLYHHDDLMRATPIEGGKPALNLALEWRALVIRNGASE